MINCMKTILFRSVLLLIVSLMSSVAAAQQGQGRNAVDPDRYAAGIVTKLSETMELTAGQKDSLIVVFKGFMESQREAMANRDRDKMVFLREQRDKEAEGIIKDKGKIQAYRKFIHEQTPMGRGPRGNGQ